MKQETFGCDYCNTENALDADLIIGTDGIGRQACVDCSWKMDEQTTFCKECGELFIGDGDKCYCCLNPVYCPVCKAKTYNKDLPHCWRHISNDLIAYQKENEEVRE